MYQSFLCLNWYRNPLEKMTLYWTEEIVNGIPATLANDLFRQNNFAHPLENMYWAAWTNGIPATLANLSCCREYRSRRWDQSWCERPEKRQTMCSRLQDQTKAWRETFFCKGHSACEFSAVGRSAFFQIQGQIECSVVTATKQYRCAV